MTQNCALKHSNNQEKTHPTPITLAPLPNETVMLSSHKQVYMLTDKNTRKTAPQEGVGGHVIDTECHNGEGNMTR